VAELSSVRGNFTNVPIVLGEYDASQLNTEPAARWKWFDHVVRTAQALDMLPMLWDNGLDNLDRATGKWRDQTAIDIMMHALAGRNNSLPDSTTDPAATVQTSSAYVFNKLGQTPGNQTLPFLLNGNTIRSLKIGSSTLSRGRDYSITGTSNITLHASFLAKYLSATAAPGTKANITVTFSSGAPSRVELVQWDVPKFASLSSAARDASAGGDLSIPVEWRGLHRVAAVQVVKADGGYLFDDWTQWLGPLQKGRAVSFVPIVYVYEGMMG
jgi:endoglucanase